MPARHRLVLPAVVTLMVLATGACAGSDADFETPREPGTVTDGSATSPTPPEPSAEPGAAAMPASDLPPGRIDSADAAVARDFASGVLAATADVTSMHQTLLFEGNFYEMPDAPQGHIELFVSPDAVHACTVVDLSIQCSQTTPEGLAGETALVYEYGAHGSVAVGEQAAEYAEAALTFTNATDKVDFLQEDETAYHMMIDPAKVDAATVGLDPGLLADTELMSAFYVVDAEGLPTQWSVTVSAGTTVATVITTVDQVNEHSAMTETLAQLDAL